MKTRKKMSFLMLLWLSLFGMTAMATPPTGVLNGTYIVGGNGADFTTITAAVNHLNNNGVSGEVIFLLNKDVFDNVTGGESFPIIINGTYSQAANHDVIFRPAPSKDVVIKAQDPNSYTGYEALFKLNGAKRVIFDGSNNGTDSKNLSLINNSNLNYMDRTAIWITNASNKITLRNLIVKQGYLNGNYAMSMGVFAGGSSVGEAGGSPVSDFLVEGLLFQGVKQGVYLANSTNTPSSNIRVIENDFGDDAGVDYMIHGIYLQGVENFEISKNIIYDLETTFTGGDNYGGIYIGGKSKNGKIHKNRITGIDRKNNHFVSGIRLSSTDTSNNLNILVANNFIANIRSLGGGSYTQSGVGLYIEKGKGYKIYHNTINQKENQATKMSMAVLIDAAKDLDIRNNIFINKQDNNSNDANNRVRKVALAFTSSPNMATVFVTGGLDYNNYWVLDPGVAHQTFIAALGGLNDGQAYPAQFKRTLLTWKAFTGTNYESHSGSENTAFVSESNLHIINPDAWVKGAGISLASQFESFGLPYDDIDGQLRSTSGPDIGADEFGSTEQDCQISIYWNGTSWGDAIGSPLIINGQIITQPNEMLKAVLLGTYDTQVSGSFKTCELTVGTGGSLIVRGGDYVHIVNALKNNQEASSVIIENNGSLVQQTDTAVNVGAITYKRATKPMYSYDFTYWGSPVADQVITALGPKRYRWDATVQAGYSQAGWVSYTGNMIPGQGYIVKAPNNFPSNPAIAPQVHEVTFTGTPNNGIFTIETIGDPGNTLGGNPDAYPQTGYPSGDYAWNFLSNPYASALDLVKFREENHSILGTNAYVWTHNTKPIIGNNLYSYVANDFAVYNIALRKGTSASPYEGGGTTLNPNYNVPTRYVASGQGFFVAAKNGSISFNNSMRTTSQGGILPNDNFYRQNGTTSATESEQQVESSVYKLSIRNEQGAFHQAMIAYVDGASEGLDEFDGASLGGNFVNLYTIADSTSFVLQGRPLPFQTTDEVLLGMRLTLTGTFSIHLDYFDGLFSEDQDIYIKDNLLNVTHNLKLSPYSFYAEEGSLNDRFSIVYSNTTLSTSEVSIDNQWTVKSNPSGFQILSQGFDFAKVEVYDLTGRLIYHREQIDNNSHQIDVNVNRQVLLIKITTTEGKTSTRKVM